MKVEDWDTWVLPSRGVAYTATVFSSRAGVFPCLEKLDSAVLCLDKDTQKLWQQSKDTSHGSLLPEQWGEVRWSEVAQEKWEEEHWEKWGEVKISDRNGKREVKWEKWSEVMWEKWEK